MDFSTAMNHVTINLVQQFTASPGGRSRKFGPRSGEEFREDFVLPALKRGAIVEVVLDGANGLPSSFLDEAFRPLKEYFKKNLLKITLTDNEVAKQILAEKLAD